MIDTSLPLSPGWWLNRLIKQLAARRARYDLLDSYYQGTAEIPVHASQANSMAYRRLMRMAHLNFANLIVEAQRERMRVVGFRTGASGDDLDDSVAWGIFQANALDADFKKVLRASLSMGDAYMIVGPVDNEIGAPLITPEDPRQVFAETDPRRRRRVLAAVKVFHDDVESFDRAFLYLPGVVYRAARRSSDGMQTWDSSGFEWDGAPQRLPVPIVPVFRFTNRADMAGEGTGEFEAHLPALDSITEMKRLMLGIASVQAFKQRGIKGVPNVDQAGNEINYDDIFSADPGALWVLPESAEIWESGQVDLNPLRQAIRDDVQNLAGVTRTPLFYLSPDAAQGSAEGASLAREGLVFKTVDAIDDTSEDLEAVMSTALLFAGETERAKRSDMEVLWADPQRFSLNERSNAAAQAAAGGMPWRTVMSDIWQFSPQKIARMETERAADAMLTDLPDVTSI